jgi:hypothetical protein
MIVFEGFSKDSKDSKRFKKIERKANEKVF